MAETRSFTFHTSNAKVLKNLVEGGRGMMAQQTVTWHFTPSGIWMSEMDDEGELGLCFRLNAQDFEDASVNTPRELHVSFYTLRDQLSAIKAKDGLELYASDGSNNLGFELFRDKVRRSISLRGYMTRDSKDRYRAFTVNPKEFMNGRKPNVTIDCTEFHNACNSIKNSSKRCAYAEIRAYEKGFSIASLNTNVTSEVHEFGDCSGSPVIAMKAAVSKLVGLSKVQKSGCMFSVYAQHGQPIMLRTRLHTVGKFYAFFHEPESKEEE